MSPRRPSEEEREASSFFQDSGEETKLATRGRQIPGPPCGWRTTFAAVCVVLVTLCVGRNQGYKLPTVTVPGPRLVGVAWDELPQPWSPRVCIAVPLSRRLCQIYAEWPWSQFGLGGKKREKLMQNNPRVTWHRPPVPFDMSPEALL